MSSDTSLLDALTLDELDELLTINNAKSMKELMDSRETTLTKSIVWLVKRRENSDLTLADIGKLTLPELSALTDALLPGE